MGAATEEFTAGTGLHTAPHAHSAKADNAAMASVHRMAVGGGGPRRAVDTTNAIRKTAGSEGGYAVVARGKAAKRTAYVQMCSNCVQMCHGLGISAVFPLTLARGSVPLLRSLVGIVAIIHMPSPPLHRLRVAGLHPGVDPVFEAAAGRGGGAGHAPHPDAFSGCHCHEPQEEGCGTRRQGEPCLWLGAILP